jgi:hypothetical protein
MMLRRGVELKFKGKSLWDDLEQDGPARYCKTSRTERRAGKKIEKELLRKEMKRLETSCVSTNIKWKQC